MSHFAAQTGSKSKQTASSTSLGLNNNNSNNNNNNSFNAASTPGSKSDPNDEIWLEFLSSLQEPVPSNQSNDTAGDTSALNITFSESNHTSVDVAHSNITDTSQGEALGNSNPIKKKKTHKNNLLFSFNELFSDNDDDDNDPDFTVLDNYELDENYDYMDDWFQVPSKRSPIRGYHKFL